MKNIENMYELIDVISFRGSNDAIAPQVFTFSNQLMHRAIADVADAINRDGMITVDVSDLRTLFWDAGITIMVSSIASSEDRAIIATDNAIARLFLEVEDITRVRQFLISIMHIGSLNLKEVVSVIKRVITAVDEDALIVTCTAVNESMDDKIRVTIFAIGFGTPLEGNSVIKIRQN